ASSSAKKPRQSLNRRSNLMLSSRLCPKANPRLFFFQAEDGIRDFHVTGVQTCALPILSCRQWRVRAISTASCALVTKPTAMVRRSEERRVGKEWVARLSFDY